MFWRNPIYGHLNYSFPHHRLCLGTNCQSHASWGLVSFGPWWSKYYLYSFVIWSFKVWSSGSVDIIRCVQVRWVGNTEELGTTWATWGQVRGPPVGTVGCQEASGLSTCLLCPHPPQGEWKWSNLAYIIPHASILPFKLEKFLQIPSNMNWKYNILLDIEANICTLSPNFLVCGNFQQTGRTCKNKSLLCSDLMVFWSVG